MAVEAFLQPSDVRHTVEKSVKPKKSTKELTTVESPGRPVEKEKPSTPIKKRKSRTKKPTSKARAYKPKRDSILIITEKPQAAQKIASALGTPQRSTEGRVSYYELSRNNENIIVASAVGHLFNLTYSKGQTGWPIYKTEWVPSHLQKKAGFTKPYFNLLAKLSKRAKEIIVATDYDIEGEVIGWNVLRFISGQEDAKRMKYSTLTAPELQKSYDNLMPTLDWGHAYAGETRHKIDWLYGINLSRALMSAIKRTDSFRILSIGRVQGPALKIIVDRDREIENFKPQPFWQVLAKANNIEFKHPKDIFDKAELSQFEGITEAQAETKDKEENLRPPHPFDLTTLQREAHRHYRISPSNTLKIAQSLYLDGIISYPRTSSQKIPKEINPKEILRKLARSFPTVSKATRPFPVEGHKSDPAHPSIYPTGEFKSLSGPEEKVYNLIAKRFISAFSEDAKTANRKITLTAPNGKKFTATGLRVLKKGWTETYPTKFEERDLPDMNGQVKINQLRHDQKETQPPKRFTAASLITILEKKNLGTKATRSAIVDTLFNRGYLDGKSIQATPLGRKLISALERYSPIIIDENLTRSLEEKMEEIQNIKEKHLDKEKEILQSVETLITDISKEFKPKELEIGQQLLEGTKVLIEKQKEENKIMPCPNCDSGNLTIKYSKKTKKSFAACDAYPKCKTTFSLPPGSVIKTTGKKNEEGLPILKALKKGRKPWHFPFDPNWRNKQHSQKS